MNCINNMNNFSRFYMLIRIFLVKFQVSSEFQSHFIDLQQRFNRSDNCVSAKPKCKTPIRIMNENERKKIGCEFGTSMCVCLKVLFIHVCKCYDYRKWECETVSLDENFAFLISFSIVCQREKRIYLHINVYMCKSVCVVNWLANEIVRSHTHTFTHCDRTVFILTIITITTTIKKASSTIWNHEWRKETNGKMPFLEFRCVEQRARKREREKRRKRERHIQKRTNILTRSKTKS